MPADEYSLEDAADHIAQLRGELAQKEEQQEITTLIVDGQLTATGGTAAAPTVILTDTWHDTGALSNGWTKGGFFKYRLTAHNTVAVSARSLDPNGTDTDGTVVCSAANGLPAAYRPLNAKAVPAWTDVLRAGGGAPALIFETDGSVQCSGIAIAASSVDIPYGEFPLDI